MSRTSIVAILAGFGIIFSGEVTSEAVAFARVVQTANPTLLIRYSKMNPTSPFADMAIEIAVKCETNWVGGGCGTTGINTILSPDIKINGESLNAGKPPKFAPPPPVEYER